MKINEGKIDRIIRIIAGLAILSLTFVGPESKLGLLGIVPLITGITGYCPLYSILGINTCGIKKE